MLCMTRSGESPNSLTGTKVTTPPPPSPSTASITSVPLGSRKEHGAQRYSTCIRMIFYAYLRLIFHVNECCDSRIILEVNLMSEILCPGSYSA